MEGLKLALANLVVYVHPSRSTNISEAILAELSSLLFKFNETFDGVVLAYEPQVQSFLAKILPGIHPYLGVRLQSELLIFHPKPDMLLEGEVVKLSEQSIHVIVLGFSSAVITDADIREEFEYKTKDDKEVFRSNAHRKHRIRVGTIIRFLAKSFDEEILHISGSLLPAHTGCVKWMERHFEELAQSKSITKKRKATEVAGEILVHDEVANDRETISMKAGNTNDNSKRRKERSS